MVGWVYDEPELSPAAQRVLAAVLLSLGLHLAILGLLGATVSHVNGFAQTGRSGGLQVSIVNPPLSVPAIPPVMTGQAGMPVSLRQSTPTSIVQSDSTPRAPANRSARQPDPQQKKTDQETGDVSNQPASGAQNSVSSRTERLSEKDISALRSSVGADPVAKTAPLPLLANAPAQPVYYTASQLDVLPQAIGHIEPIFPPLAVQQGKTGWVLLEIKLDVDGNVVSVHVKEADPPGVFDDAAREAFLHGRFQPGQRNGVTVDTLINIRVSFK